MYQLRYCAQATNAKFHTTLDDFLMFCIRLDRVIFTAQNFIKQILVGPSLAVGIPDIEKYSTITFIINYMNH